MVHRSESGVRTETFSDHGLDVARLNGVGHRSAVFVDGHLALRVVTHAKILKGSLPLLIQTIVVAVHLRHARAGLFCRSRRRRGLGSRLSGGRR